MEEIKKKGLRGKLAILAILAGAIALVFSQGWHHYLTLEQLKASRDGLVAYADQHLLLSIAIFMAVYILVTALSIPGATIMTLAGGAVFGRWIGTGSVLVAATIGATLAMLAARYLVRDSIEAKFKERLQAVNQGLEREGDFYLFAMRLIPAVPFFVINLVMGLTQYKTARFFAVSLVGMAPGSFVYVNAGTEIAGLNSPGDIASPGLIGAFVALGLLPLLLKQVLKKLRPS